MRDLLRSLFGAENRASDDANTQMLDQFYGTLQAILYGIDISNAPAEVKALHAATKAILEAPADGSGPGQRSWNRAYMAEKMLARLRPVASLRYELQTQIAFLSSLSPETAQEYRTQFLALFPSPPQRIEMPGAPAAPEEVAPEGPRMRMAGE